MFVMRPELLEAFRQATLDVFVSDMVQHCRTFAPRHCEELNEQELRGFIRRSVDRAGGYGLTNRGPIRLYLELQFLLGSSFDTDPQYPWAAKILRAPHDEMERAGWLFQKAIDFQEEVAGPDGASKQAALESLSIVLSRPLATPSRDFVPAVLREMDKTFPRKVRYVGQAGLSDLLNRARQAAGELGLSTTRGEVLVSLLMFFFGHGLTRDPLFPWVARAVHDVTSHHPDARAERLAEEARGWIHRLVASPAEGAKA